MGEAQQPKEQKPKWFNSMKKLFKELLSSIISIVRSRLVETVAAVIVLLGIYAVSQLESVRFPPFSPRTIVLQSEPYHIGDVEFKARLNEKGEIVERFYFDHPAPEANPFSADFKLDQIPNEAALVLTARDVDPDEMSSPVQVLINSRLQGYLNRKFQSETMEPRTVTMTVKCEDLRIGSNTLMVLVQPTKIEYSGFLNLDDIEFWNVKLELR